jgi:hypothetical protein
MDFQSIDSGTPNEKKAVETKAKEKGTFLKPKKPVIPRVPKPAFRYLQHFAFDPSFSRRIETVEISEVTAELPWDDGLKPGPVDDYLEVVDYDPASKCFYAPVNLEDPLILAQRGLPPSVSNPQFHQQMVYAVARTTIGHFERALGRKALWAPHRWYKKDGVMVEDFVRRLRIYPHALREANAYYSPAKKALLFGYFPASADVQGNNYPGEMVFACLSHDIIAHETTHALLDGLHRRFIEPSNVDVLAFHEAFADIVALFQHFTHPEVLYQQIAMTRGDLQAQNYLGELAYQFGQAIGQYGALRSALGHYDQVTNQWVPAQPDPRKILTTTEPHARGAILVAAVFDAFLAVYKWRISPLLRIATGGTSILPLGQLHPDLVNKLAAEAAKTAGHILQICIRALDYCPPVDIDFGDYLRALVTSDAELVSDDKHNYRLAFIEAFRRHGIYPRDVRNMSEESLLWNRPDLSDQETFHRLMAPDNLIKVIQQWEVTQDRETMYKQALDNQAQFHDWLGNNSIIARAAKIVLDQNTLKSIYRDEKTGLPRFEVYSVRPARRVGPDGQSITELVVEITQRRRGYNEPSIQKGVDNGELIDPETLNKPDFIFRGGCTVLIDPFTSTVRYFIYKQIDNPRRLERQRDFLNQDDNPSLSSVYFGDPRHNYYRQYITNIEEKKEGFYEAFAFLHRSKLQEEVL